jgi:hypothetical protein
MRSLSVFSNVRRAFSDFRIPGAKQRVALETTVIFAAFISTFAPFVFTTLPTIRLDFGGSLEISVQIRKTGRLSNDLNASSAVPYVEKEYLSVVSRFR